MRLSADAIVEMARKHRHENPGRTYLTFEAYLTFMSHELNEVPLDKERVLRRLKQVGMRGAGELVTTNTALRVLGAAAASYLTRQLSDSRIKVNTVGGRDNRHYATIEVRVGDADTPIFHYRLWPDDMHKDPVGTWEDLERALNKFAKDMNKRIRTYTQEVARQLDVT